MRMPTLRSVAGMTILASIATHLPVHGGQSPPVKPEVELEMAPADDAAEVFELLVERYRTLPPCREEVRIEHLTVDGSTEDPPLRSVIRAVAEIDDERLTVRSSDLIDELTEAMGPGGDEPATGASESDLHLLPHLRLRFSEDPLEDFGGVASGSLHPAGVQLVIVDDRELLRLELKSGESGSSLVTFDLFIDPASMLIERVDGEEWLPGGIHHRITILIEDREMVETEAPPRMEAPPSALKDSSV